MNILKSVINKICKIPRSQEESVSEIKDHLNEAYNRKYSDKEAYFVWKEFSSLGYDLDFLPVNDDNLSDLIEWLNYE